jgi:hypothetical protein
MAGQFQAVGAYANVSNVVSAAAQTAILAEVEKLGALIDMNGAGSEGSMASPEFDRLHPALSKQLRAEIDALKAAIDAAPTA